MATLTSGNTLSLDFSSVAIPENTGLNYLAIDSSGKITSFPIFSVMFKILLKTSNRFVD